jgi:hypothetical protein
LSVRGPTRQFPALWLMWCAGHVPRHASFWVGIPFTMHPCMCVFVVYSLAGNN